ncbi:MAG: hypothetical protein ACI4K7_10355, partial [Oscillospiraceae bacterium]
MEKEKRDGYIMSKPPFYHVKKRTLLAVAGCVWLTAGVKEPLIKSFLDALSDGFSSVGNDA